MVQSGQSGQPGRSGQSGKGGVYPRRFGKYTLLSHLATGGMADVFLARHLGPAGFEKECVLKRILPHLSHDPNNRDFIDMFLDEARIAARLSHPNIVQIFDLGQEGGDYFLALEFIDGLTIENIIERVKQAGQPALPWPIAVRIVSNVAEGLEHAHKAKDSSGNPLLLVHRDISPSNIMLSWDGVAKILDFGIAKVMSVSSAKVRTGVGIIKGKVPYMSPEQIQGLDLDARSDVFSLGAVLYEMTTGQRPFPGDNTNQLTLQITSREPRPPEQLNPAFPRDLWPLLLRALAKSVHDRYQSARDLKLDLEQFLSDQHVSCTNYDVEAYLRELVPERPQRQLPSAEEIARVEAEAVAAAAAPAPSIAAGVSESVGAPSGREPAAEPVAAPVESGPKPAGAAEGRSAIAGRGASGARNESSGPGIDVYAAEQDEAQRRKRESGHSGVIMGAIAGLVLVTAIVFYVLHERAVKQSDAASTPAVAAPASSPSPPTPAPAVPAAAPAAVAATTPVAPPVAASKGVVPAAAAKPSPPVAAKAPAEAAKPAAKPESRPAKKPKHKEEGGGSSPSSLPLPPPPPPEEG